MLTHLDANHQPRMVDISAKDPSLRSATAQALVQLPAACQAHLQGEELHLKKGPVFQTAIIAGTMAVKKTAEAIPFCHTIPVESCQLRITIDDSYLVTILCQVKTHYGTGVEMEALHGATIAALTIYDMCKSLSHEIIIQEIKLLEKMGGKHLIRQRPLYGLVLTGGHSKRMQQDKALLDYHGQPHAAYLYELLGSLCEQVFLSCRPQQWQDTSLESLPQIVDNEGSLGPMSGILSALQTHPEVDWLVLACDLPHVTTTTLSTLLAHYRADVVATCYHNRDLGIPEPLCAIYTPAALSRFQAALANGITCPVKVLKSSPCEYVDPGDPWELANINTPEQYKQAQNHAQNT